jgi:hypothetical protein
VLTGVFDHLTETRALALVVREYDDALLRFTLEGKDEGPSTFVYGYVIAYGAERHPCERPRRGWQQRRLLSGVPDANHVEPPRGLPRSFRHGFVRPSRPLSC